MISARETKLIPRQSPQRPPKPEMKSNQVIFGDLSNSGCKDLIWYNLELQLTVDSRLSEEDVHDGNVSLIGIVVGFPLKLSIVSSLDMIGFNLCEGCYELPVIHGVWILLPHWSWGLVDVVCRLVSISLEDAWLPHCQRCWTQVAKRTQIQIPWITWTENLICRNAVSWKHL